MTCLARITLVCGLATLLGCGAGFPGLLNPNDQFPPTEDDELEEIAPLEGVSTDSPSQAYDIYLQLDSVQGTATHADHKDWIEVISVTDGLIEPMTDATSRRGNMNIGPIEIVKRVDIASTPLRQGALTGQLYSNAKIAFREPSEKGNIVWQIELTKPGIVNLTANITTDENATRPTTETIIMEFEVIRWTYYQYDDQGNLDSSISYDWTVQSE